ncbi:hypothetical protein GCM10010365_57600 [Streptomyces poonensis]|uniref:AttH domain-containing protein n=2 Tax=Streptomyces poonensis TaxID=68255 RepID=A0A918Q240_9ACTN|nr:hypothetical protein GCM10010365_57600 [Streptomyces poonensis]
MLKGAVATAAVAAVPAGLAARADGAFGSRAELTGGDVTGALTSNTWGSTAADHARVGLRPGTVQQWEDGWRTADRNADPDVFEWWYSDFTGDDGTVISFTVQTRLDDGFVPAPGAQRRRPSAVLIVTDPDGTGHRVAPEYTWSGFHAATDRCAVRVGAFSFSGDLRTYRMKGQVGGVGVDLTLTSTTRPYRAGTGFVFLGATDHYMAWLPTVPHGRAEGTVTVNGTTRPFTGIGYHDHNWGTLPFPYFMDHWRWGRASADRYAVICGDVHLRPEWGSGSAPTIVIDDTRTGRRLVGACSDRSVTARQSAPGPHPDPAYPADYYSTVTWNWSQAGDKATITLTDTDTLITTRRYAADPTPVQQRALDRLGTDQIWYTRFDAAMSLNLTSDGRHHQADTGAGTLEGAQFDLADASPKSR